MLITIPINGYVSADENGPVNIHDPGRFQVRLSREAPAKVRPLQLEAGPGRSGGLSG